MCVGEIRLQTRGKGSERKWGREGRKHSSSSRWVLRTGVKLSSYRAPALAATASAPAPASTPAREKNHRDDERVSYSFADKRKILLFAAANGRAKACARFDVSASTFTNWTAETDRIFAAVRAGLGHMKKLRPIGSAWETRFDKAFRLWTTCRESLVAVTTQTIRDLWLRDDPHITESAMEDALARFKERFKLSSRATTGVSQLLPADHEKLVSEHRRMLAEMYAKYFFTVVVVLDETSVFHQPSSTRTLEKTGTNVVRVLNPSEKESSTCLLAAMYEVPSGLCEHLTPQVLFAASATGPISKEWSSCRSARVACTPSGWQTGDSFLQYLKDELPDIRGFHGLLVMDLHQSHLTEPVRNWLKKKNWHVKYVPAGCTSVEQVHDLVVNKPFKAALRKEYSSKCIDAAEKAKATGVKIDKRDLRSDRAEVVRWVVAANKAVRTEVVRAAIQKHIVFPMMPPEPVAGAVAPGAAVADAVAPGGAASADAIDVDANDDEGDDALEVRAQLAARGEDDTEEVAQLLAGLDVGDDQITEE